MNQLGRPKAPLELTDDERTELERLARRARTNRRLAFRAKLILSSAEGISNTEVARRHRTSNQTVGLWRKRFLEGRLDSLFDEPRVGSPRKITDEAVEQVVVDTLESKPKGRTHWSTRKMAEKAGISHSSIGRIWRAFGLKPHVVKDYTLSTDPQFVDKVRDVVGLYMNPPERAVVFCFDEKTQIQALERAQPILPMDLGQPERQTHNYLRHGTVDLLAALNVATGKVVAQLRQKHRTKEFLEFLRELDRHVEADLELHVILDNLSAHKAKAVQRFLIRNPRIHLHFTPTYSSWLNLVERFFGLLTEHALRRGSHTSVPQLRDAIMEYVEAHNAEGKPFKWTRTADQILDSVRRFGQRTLQVHRDEDNQEITDPGD